MSDDPKFKSSPSLYHVLIYKDISLLMKGKYISQLQVNLSREGDGFNPRGWHKNLLLQFSPKNCLLKYLSTLKGKNEVRINYREIFFKWE